jgi:hypothetical protein
MDVCSAGIAKRRVKFSLRGAWTCYTARDRTSQHKAQRQYEWI